MKLPRNLRLFCPKCLSEPNRRIPRTFDGSYISKDRLLKQTLFGDGLILDGYGTSLRLIMLPLGLDLSGERDILTCANGYKESIRVNSHEILHPPLDHDSTMKSLVVEREDEVLIGPNLHLEGCCLHLSDSIHLS